jgi:hypothetical protein
MRRSPMTQDGTAELVFHFEVDNDDADLQAIKEAIDAELVRADGVEEVSSEVLGTDRFVDPVTIGEMIVTVTVAVKEAKDLVATLNGLVEEVKKLGVSLGVKAWLENRRKRLDIDANANTKAVAETAAANVRSSAQTT